MSEFPRSSNTVEKENAPEKYGRNVKVVNYWNRHAQKKSAEGFDSSTGGISLSNISPKGFVDSINFGKGIKASELGVVRTYVSKIERTTETAKGILKGYEEANPEAAIRDITISERLTAPIGEFPKDFFDLYIKKFSESRDKLMIEKGLAPSNFDKLSPDDQADIAEVAEEPVIEEWLSKGTELNNVFDPAIAAKDFGRLFYFHNIRIPGLVHSGSELDLLHVSHRAIMEPFLVSGVLISQDNGQRVTDIKELGGAMNLLEGWKSTTETDENGVKRLIVKLRGKSYDVDMEMLREMGKPQEKK